MQHKTVKYLFAGWSFVKCVSYPAPNPVWSKEVASGVKVRPEGRINLCLGWWVSDRFRIMYLSSGSYWIWPGTRQGPRIWFSQRCCVIPSFAVAVSKFGNDFHNVPSLLITLVRTKAKRERLVFPANTFHPHYALRHLFAHFWCHQHQQSIAAVGLRLLPLWNSYDHSFICCRLRSINVITL